MRRGAQASPDGWVSTTTLDGAEVHIRVRRGPDGRVRITGVLIEADEVTTDTLRQIKLGMVRGAVRGRRPSPVPPVTDVFVSGDALLELYADADDSSTTIGDLRARAKGHRLGPEPREAVGRPDGRNPDEFYRRFASTYRSAVAESTRPAVLLASENDVPVETVRRWIKEARRRGHLKPGSKGRAG
jgi:hypothetical protein